MMIDLRVPGCLTSFLYLLFSPTEKGRVAFVFPIESHEVEPIKAWHTVYDRFYANLTHDIVSRHITTWSKKMRSSSLKKRLKCVVGLWVVLIHFSRSIIKDRVFHICKLLNHCSVEAGCQVIRTLEKTDGGVQVVGTEVFHQ